LKNRLPEGAVEQQPSLQFWCRPRSKKKLQKKCTFFSPSGRPGQGAAALPLRAGTGDFPANPHHNILNSFFLLCFAFSKNSGKNHEDF
jgi:hypothetical protein